MRNRILSITRSNIPYVKELHPLTGSVIGCLVMQQLDYWFSSQPEGFYKFLEPADHPAYKEGDSWVEELGMSADEFRYAFDRISIRYKSRTEFEKASKTGDLFKGKFYCSYIDRRANLTHYFRNHDLVDAALDQLICDSSLKTNSKSKGKRVVAPTKGVETPLEDSIPVTDCSESNIPVTGNSDLQNWKNRFTELEIPVCVAGNPDSPEPENPLYVKRLFRGPLLQRLHTETTTTTTGTDELSTELVDKRCDTESSPLPPVSEPPRGCGDDFELKQTEPQLSDLIWPKCSPEEWDALAEILKTIPATQRQVLLDELEGARAAGKVRSGLMPFAGGLVRAMLKRTFTVGYSPAIAARRREQASNRDKTVYVRKPPDITTEDLARGQAVLSKILGQPDAKQDQSTSSLQP